MDRDTDSRCPRSYTLRHSLRLLAEQRELALLGIETHQRADNLLHHCNLVLRVASIELAALDPRGIALLPQGEFSLRFGNLFGK